MVAQVAAADLILTTIGRVAVRPLAGYLAKNGGKKFAQQYGPKAFEAVLGTTVGLKAYKETEEYLSEYLNHIDEGGEEGSFVPKGSMPDTDRMKQMDSMMAVPNVNPNINRSIRGTPAGLVIGDTGQKEKERERIAAEEKERMKGAPAPKVETGWKESFPDQSGELIDSSLPPSTPEPIELPQESFPDLSDELNKPQTLYNKDDSEFKYPTTEELKNSIKEENKFWEEEVIPEANEKRPQLNIKNLPKIVEADKHFGAAAMSFSNFSESQLIYMSPQEYLDLTKRFRPVGTQGEGSKLNSDNIEQLLKDGKELANIPFLNVTKVGDSYKVTGQEGIHRAIAFKNLGYDKMPVVIEGTGKDKVAGVENKVYTATPKSYLYTEDWAKDYIGFIPKSIQSDGKVLLTNPEDFYNVRTKEKLFVKDSIAKQTDKLVPEKPKFGKLTKAEKQTALALKGDKPDFYSRAVEAITNAKQDKTTKGKWNSIIQSNSTKNEMEYLGLKKFLKGNESITRQELLDFVKDKNLVPYIEVNTDTYENTAPKGMADIYKKFSLDGDNKKFTTFQINKEFYNGEVVYKDAHSDTYGDNMFAHARTQIGIGDPEFPSADLGKDAKKITTKLKNTTLVDEIQSPWLQRLQKFGPVSQYDIEYNDDGKYTISKDRKLIESIGGGPTVGIEGVQDYIVNRDENERGVKAAPDFPIPTLVNGLNWLY
jgi:hypothetical protein